MPLRDVRVDIYLNNYIKMIRMIKTAIITKIIYVIHLANLYNVLSKTLSSGRHVFNKLVPVSVVPEQYLTITD